VQAIHGTRGDFTDYRALPLPGCRAPWTVHRMDGCGALPHFERPDEVLGRWREHVSAPPPGAGPSGSA
jgi:hypothetical protein